ncbi:hypothetical protein BGX27_003837 [Mortierella sp. AM989]|nr:hypothetical protein BGX27_003837 [Mortierella sp. AM989]
MVAKLDILISKEPGKSISVAYKDDEAIFLLMQRIANKLGETDETSYGRGMYINGVRLNDQQESIARYRVFGNCLTYKPGQKHKVFVRVNMYGRDPFFLCCTRDTTIDKIKQAIQDRYELRSDDLGISVESEGLSDLGPSDPDPKTLHEYGIDKNATICAYKRQLGGGMSGPGFDFADVSNASNVRKRKLTSDGPAARTVCRGTNVECKCECTSAYRVICMKKFGMVELSQVQLCCPSCGKSNKITPVTVGFRLCKYRFHGIKENDEQYTSDWKDVEQDDGYQLFDPSKKTTWKRLVIESAPLGRSEDCAICLEHMPFTTALGCGHRFHKECYEQWNSSCPNCRFNQHLITGGKPKDA